MANRIYVSGPMSGVTDFNFPEFNRTAEWLASLGWEVENPADKGIIEGWGWEDYLKYDLKKIVDCDAIYMMKGWEGSRGAVLERHVAESLGLEIFYAGRNPVTGVAATVQEYVEDLATTSDTGLPTTAAERKAVPIATGVLDYFPDAIVEIARVSKVGNDQHNPGQPLHWAKEKSTDESDALIRHFLERGKRDVDGMRHTAKVAWRALALLQRELDAEK